MVEPDQVSASALQDAVSEERVRTFYENRDWQPAWTPDNVGSLVESLRGAGQHGLDPREFVTAIDEASEPTARELALTTAALDLADVLADGRADPAELFEVYTLERPEVDIVAGLSQAASENSAGEWLEALAPSDAEYQALSEAYMRFAERAASGQDSSIESGDAIEQGDTDPRVGQIVAKLQDNGYLQDSERENPDLYSERIASAVAEMQRDFGVKDDGIIGPDTLEILNTGAEERARLLAVNMERRRWYARELPSTRVEVNIADATLKYMRDGELRDSRRVVVGQPDWETPQLRSAMFRLVANPTWTVPKSIEREELASKGPGYLDRNNMVRRDGYIVQLPGPENALGEVKFDMQNDQAIYLHDTAAMQLFERNQRHFSHGCVRVNDALEFAQMLARDQQVSSEYQQARGSGEETFVEFDDNLPVRLVYHTAFADRSGNIRFRMDPYGWDEAVAEALGYEPRQVARVRTEISDIGP
ncbi:L,D-transpeptidase family protein [Erythrobacter sp. JGD-13]|uniref:L,D-transpeptidase family protein n=1 Tax=Aurantiacibacter sediminis TaxID=2793064 RepID=A0ABS0N1N3_9SPHN|nr:L,D-transpeptidase family protein [Aurantiacibacter sediminis]